MIEVKNLNNAILFADKHKSIYTGYIHYKNEREETRDIIPLTENILYAISKVATLSREKAEEGLKLLERLFAFCTDDGFISCVHDFPHVYNDKTNVDICLALSFFLKNFGKVIPAVSSVKIKAMREKLVAILRKRPLKEIDNYVFETSLFMKDRSECEIHSLHEYERVALCKLLMNEKLTLPYHEKLGVYTGPLNETYYRNYLPLDSLFSQLIQNKGDTNQSLYAALLPKTGWQDLISFKKVDRDDLYINHRGDHVSIHFDNHTIIAKGFFEIKATNDHIDIFLDEFEEINFYFSDYQQSSVVIDSTKATAFYPDDSITLVTEHKVITMRFICPKHPFMGHIMKGNRHNQITETNKNFSLFDHKIHLKKTL